MKSFTSLIIAVFLLGHTSSVLGSNERYASSGSGRKPSANRTANITVVPVGPTQSEIDAAKIRAASAPAVERLLAGTNSRAVAFEVVENGVTAAKRFKVYFYDYTNDRTIVAEGDLIGREGIRAYESTLIPGVSDTEINAAKKLIAIDPLFGPRLQSGALDVFEAMPPITVLNGERLINIGLSDRSTGESLIVGVSFKNSKLVRYANNAPPMSRATPESCGIASANQGSSGSGLSGQYLLTVTQNGTTIWEMTVVRPSASSGNVSERSGIEVRDVRYKGKSVLKRGHAPILNVKYQNDVCGPYRDWQYSEGYFQIPTTGVTFPNGQGGGIALLPAGTSASTVVETRNDTGNFQGVAIYQQDIGNGNEVVLVTEMNAGWYRYIMEWRFGNDGTIRPRYGFGSISNSCVCSQRTHHVYWRLDFDIVQPTNRVMRLERGRRFLSPITTESLLFKNYALNRGLLIQNSNGDEAYQLIPGTNDGAVAAVDGTVFDPFGAGDFWIMRFSGTSDAPAEIDDQNLFGTTSAQLSPWLNGESLVNQDVVIWYAAHQVRIDDASLTQWKENIIAGEHVVGPDIRPIRW